MNKRILSIFLVLVWLCGMIPVTTAVAGVSSSVTNITSAEVTGITLSKAGEKPDFTANVVSEYADLREIEMYICTSEGNRRSSNLIELSTIDSGTYCRVNVTLVPHENYAFDYTNLDFTINGKKVNYTVGNDGSVTGYIIYHTGYAIKLPNSSDGAYTYVSGKGVSSSADEGQQIQLFHGNKGADYEFEGWTVTTKSGSTITVNPVQSGAGVMYYNFIMPAEDVTIRENWTLKKIASTIELTSLPTKTVYNSGEYFDPTGIAVTVNYTDGTKRVFTKDDIELKNIYLFANESGTINIASSGLKVEQTVVYVEADGLITSFPITVEPSTKIYEVAFTMTGYELGGSIDNWGISVDTEHVFLTSINGVSVDISNQSDLDGDVTIFKNNQHTLQIPIELESGYEKAFTKDNITLNGIPADNLRSVSGKYIVTFYLPNFDIRSIDITVTKPTADLTPSDIKIDLPQNAHYRLTNTNLVWTKLGGEGEYSVIIGNSSKFQAGATYSTIFTFEPIDNYAFDTDISEISATINGESVTVEASGDNIVLHYSVTAPEKIYATLMGEIVSFVDGEELITIELYKSGVLTPAYTETIIGTIDTPARYVIPQ